jgi:hypothetical protein
MGGLSGCMRRCVYGNTLSTQSPNIEPLLLNEMIVCVNVCVVVYACMECKEETQKLISHTLTYTRPDLISLG